MEQKQKGGRLMSFLNWKMRVQVSERYVASVQLVQLNDA